MKTNLLIHLFANIYRVNFQLKSSNIKEHRISQICMKNSVRKKIKTPRRNSLHTLPSVIIRYIRDLDGRHAKSATNIYETTEKKNLEKKLKYQSSNFAAS